MKMSTEQLYTGKFFDNAYIYYQHLLQSKLIIMYFFNIFHQLVL